MTWMQKASAKIHYVKYDKLHFAIPHYVCNNQSGNGCPICLRCKTYKIYYKKSIKRSIFSWKARNVETGTVRIDAMSQLRIMRVFITEGMLSKM